VDLDGFRRLQATLRGSVVRCSPRP